ncbi:unnamed protein product, partial [Ixodes hexagonus]
PEAPPRERVAPLGCKTGPVAPSSAGASVATPPSPPSPTAGMVSAAVTGNGAGGLVQPASSSSPLLVTAAPLSAGSIMAAAAANVKDSRWLQLEVCREYQRNKCSRQDAECKFAHPPPNVEVQNGRVIACYDSIKVSRVLLPA